MSAEDLQRLEAFLHEQNRPEDLMAPSVLHDFVVMTNRQAIIIGSPGTRIDSFVKLEGGQGLTIGKGVHIASFAHVGIGGGTTFIGNYAAIASGAKVISGSALLEGWSMSASAPESMQKRLMGYTHIKEFAVVLTNAVVLPGVTLGEGAVLAACGLATKNIPDWEVWGGVPAKFMCKRIVGNTKSRRVL